MNVVATLTLAPKLPGVKFYPPVITAAVKSKRHKEAALWHELRHIDSAGTGRLAYTDAVQRLSDTFHYTKPTVQRILRAGEGTFWHFQQAPANYQRHGDTGLLPWQRVVKLRSLKHVCLALGVERLTDPVRMQLRHYCRGGRGMKNAMLFKAVIPQPKRLHPISRQALEDITGVPRSTQVRHTRRAKIARRKCRAVNENGLKRRLYKCKAKLLNLPERLPNIYIVRLPRAPKGMCRRVNNVLAEKAFEIAGEGTRVRQPQLLHMKYFNDAWHYTKTKKRAGCDGFYVVRGALKFMVDSDPLVYTKNTKHWGVWAYATQ